MDKSELQEQLDWFLKNLPSYIQHNFMSHETKEKIDKIENRMEKMSIEWQEAHLKLIKNDIETKNTLKNVVTSIKQFTTKVPEKFISRSEYEIDKMRYENEMKQMKELSQQRLAILEEIRDELKELDVIRFFTKHKNIALFCVVGVSVLFLWDVKEFIIEVINFFN